MPNLTLGRLSGSISNIDSPEYQCFYFHYSKELHAKNSGYFCEKHSFADVKVVLLSAKKFASTTLEMKNNETLTIFNQGMKFLSTKRYLKRTLGNYLTSIVINSEFRDEKFKIRNVNKSWTLLASIKYGVFALIRIDGIKKRNADHRNIFIKNFGRSNYNYIRKLCLREIPPIYNSTKEVLRIVKLNNLNQEKSFFELQDVELLDGWMCRKNENFFTEDQIFDNRAEFISGLKGKVDISLLHKEQVVVDRSIANKIPSIQLDKGLIVGNRNSANWFHFLIEDLIAIWNTTSKIDTNVPLIVPETLTSNQMQALDLVCPDRRKIFCNSDLNYEIKEAFLPTRVGIFHDSVLIPWDESHFYNVNLIREFAKFMNNAAKSTSLQNKEEKIFVVRGANSTKMRRVFLTRRARKLLTKNGFIQIDAGKLSFIEQIEVFNNAKYIVSVSGAAMANLLFCKSSAQVGLFMPQSLMDFSIWKKVAEVSEADIFYQKCNPLIPEFVNLDPYQRQHQDIVVTKADVAKLLSNFNFPNGNEVEISLANLAFINGKIKYIFGAPKYLLRKYYSGRSFLYTRFKSIIKKIVTPLLLSRFLGK